MEQGLLFVDDIRVSRDETPILRGISLEVRAGEIVGVLGRNGAGKSSLAYSIMGLPEYLPESGRIVLEGQEINGWPISKRAKEGITLAWQHPARYEGITVRDYLRISARGSREADLVDALNLVQMGSLYLDRIIDKTLSGGERKRIELASVYLLRPRLAILDEPDSGVDLLAMSDIMLLFRKLVERGASVLIITHREDVAAKCDRAYLMCAGKILLEGSPEAVKRYFMSQCEPCATGEPFAAGEVRV